MLHSINGNMRALAFHSVFLSLFMTTLVGATICPLNSNIGTELVRRLSRGSSVENTTVHAQRWSLYAAPTPRYVVNVISENDVATTVEYCNKYNVSFLVQSRGNGWADTFHLGRCGILINISALSAITFNPQKTQATIQGAALVQDMVNAAYGNNTRFANPTCNCLGFLGASLGGGINRAMGLYGNGVDQIISATVVTASGRILHVDATHHPDLWYAIRGAAPNFGIVTSAVVRAYPVPKAENIAWGGALTFEDDQLEPLIQAIHDLELAPEMEIDFLFATSGPPANTPSITAIPFFIGNASAAEAAFESILKLGPTSNGAKELPYTQWGAFADSFCVKGPRKPAYGVSLSREGLDAKAWRAVYEDFKDFVRLYPEAGATTVLAEYYPVQKAVALGEGSGEGVVASYPFRDVPIHVVAIPSYADAGLDEEAIGYGERFRDTLRGADGLVGNSTYINFAHGDEPLEEVYGESLVRLQALKKRYDPYNRFNQWFPLS